MTPVYDFVGKPITIGCRCAYPVRRGSDMWLTTIRVQGINQIGETVVLSGYNDAGRKVSVRNVKNCVVVEAK
jgi:hypothetical protein